MSGPLLYAKTGSSPDVWKRVLGDGLDLITPSPPNREALATLYGTYEPQAGLHAGLIPGVALTTTETASVTLTPGTYQNTWYKRKVSCASAGTYIFRNCQIDGPVIAVRDPAQNDSAQGSLQATNTAVTSVEVYDSLIQVASPANAVNNVKGHHLKLERCHLKYGSDGVNLFLAAGGSISSWVKGCIIEELVFWRPSVNNGVRPEGTHNDAVSIEGGTDIAIIGNKIVGYYSSAYGEPTLNQYYPSITITACVAVFPNVAYVNNFQINNNWIYGGAAGINIVEKTFGPITSGEVIGNRFDRGARSGYQILIEPSSAAGITTTGNVFMDDGSPVNIGG